MSTRTEHRICESDNPTDVHHCDLALRYAIVESPSLEGSCERLVVAYHGEQSLHAVIAGCRIVASGFSSRSGAHGFV